MLYFAFVLKTFASPFGVTNEISRTYFLGTHCQWLRQMLWLVHEQNRLRNVPSVAPCANRSYEHSDVEKTIAPGALYPKHADSTTSGPDTLNVLSPTSSATTSKSNSLFVKRTLEVLAQTTKQSSAYTNITAEGTCNRKSYNEPTELRVEDVNWSTAYTY